MRAGDEKLKRHNEIEEKERGKRKKVRVLEVPN